MRSRFAFGLATALLLAVGGGALAQIQSGVPGGDPVIAELKRKAEAREPEDGFCTNRGWPPGDPTRYTQWLEAAVVGANKVNTFKNGTQCQYDEVGEVFERNGYKCVRYTWYACERGKTCARGDSEACKQPNGGWDTKG